MVETTKDTDDQKVVHVTVLDSDGKPMTSSFFGLKDGADIEEAVALIRETHKKAGFDIKTNVTTKAEARKISERAQRSSQNPRFVMSGDKKHQKTQRFPNARWYGARDTLGRAVLRVAGVPALPAPILREAWRPQEAAEMTAALVTFYQSIYGRVAMQRIIDTTQGQGYELPDADENALSVARCLSDPETIVILAKEDFTDMLMAAATSAPETPIAVDELIAPHGIMYFERETDLSGLLKTSDYPVRALRWQTMETEEEPVLAIYALVEGSHVWEGSAEGVERKPGSPVDDGEDAIGIDGEHRFLTVAEMIITTFLSDEDLPTTNEFTRGVGLVRSIAAIARSEQTRTEDVEGETPKQKKIRKRRGKPAPRTIRALSLVTPEHGRYELEAATGIKMRAHWVRGHWRKQWYATTQEHRTIWIDGFIKGDPSLGTVAGQKVHVASMPQPDSDRK